MAARCWRHTERSDQRTRQAAKEGAAREHWLRLIASPSVLAAARHAAPGLP
jgi:hypothetical protein